MLPYPELSSKKPGFTLIELLIVIAIIGILAAASIPIYTGYMRNQTLKQASQQVKNDLRAAQAKALGGVDRGTVSGWGIIFTPDSDQYQLCQFDGDTACVADGRTFELPAGTQIEGAADTIVFKQISGEVVLLGASDGVVGIRLIGEEAVRTVTATAVGNIYEQ